MHLDNNTFVLLVFNFQVPTKRERMLLQHART